MCRIGVVSLDAGDVLESIGNNRVSINVGTEVIKEKVRLWTRRRTYSCLNHLAIMNGYLLASGDAFL